MSSLRDLTTNSGFTIHKLENLFIRPQYFSMWLDLIPNIDPWFISLVSGFSQWHKSRITYQAPADKFLFKHLGLFDPILSWLSNLREGNKWFVVIS